MVRLRSGNFKIEESRVDFGHSDGNLRRVNIPDLNLNDDPDVVSSEECVVEYCEEKVLGGNEGIGMGVENEDRVKSPMNNNNEISKICSAEIGQCSGILGHDSDVSVEGKGMGVEELDGAVCLANDGTTLLKSEVMEERVDVGKSRKIGRKERVCQEESEKSLGSDVVIDEKSPCLKGVDTSSIDDKQVDSLTTTSEHVKDSCEGKLAPKDYDSDLDKSLKSDFGVVKEPRKKRSVVDSSESKYGKGDKGDKFKEKAKEGKTQVFSKVLRSRVVPANGLGEKADCGRLKASSNKRKKETDGLVEDSKRPCTRGKPKKSIDLLNGEVNELNNVKHELKTRDGGENDTSLGSLQKKGKRGKPKRSTDNLVDQVVSKIEDMSDKSTLNTGEDIQEERILIHCSKEDAEVVCKGEDKVGKVRKKSVGGSTQRRKSERSRRVVDYSEKEGVQRRKISVCKMDDGSDKEDRGLSNANVPSSKVKGKLGRPRKQVDSGSVKILSYGNGVCDDGKIKTSLITTYKGEEVSLTDNNLSVKRNRGETPGSVTAEKNLIRKQIVDMILKAGWTIEHRPRNGKDYLDAVYVNREGKTHWSVTKAYFSLQQEFEEDKTRSEVGKSNILFTPLPDEVLSRLFRVASKSRSDKNKKKNNKGDRSMTEGKSKHSGLKRKPSVQGGNQSKRRCVLVARRSKGLNPKSVESIAYSGKHSLLAWLIDLGVVSLDGKVQYMNRRKTKAKGKGKLTRDGIYCDCCKEVISVFEFEKHAGSKLGQPYENLYLEGGQSLLQCLLDSWNKQDEASLKGFYNVNIDVDDPNDDTCAICGDGGDLMCCDGCPSTFHHDCLTIEEVPSGEWHCVFCSCKFCGEATQMNDYLDTAPSPLITCCLCDEKYHESCADEENLVHVKPGRENFCGKNCEQIFEQLQILIGTKSDLENGFSWTLLQRFDVTGEADSLKARKIENNSKLAVALSVMDECFVPIIDPRSGANSIRHVVYNSGSNLRRLNFRSFFTIILEKGDEVISAASIRIHGKQLAEMPFIGTRNIYRRQGMCRRLLTAIERALSSLGVENLVIPAISELMDTWTSVFGFQPLDESTREEMRLMNMLVFAHTDMLQKPILKQKLVEKGIATLENGGNCSRSSNEQLVGEAEKSDVDDGCFNASFDLNVVAPGVHESSTNERLDDYNAGVCGGDVKSGMDYVGVDSSDKVESLPTPMEISDIEFPNSALIVNTSEGRMIPDHSDPTCDETTKTTFNSCVPTKLNMVPLLKIDPEHSKTALVGRYQNELTLNASIEEKLRPTSIPIDSATDVSSNGSMLTAVESTENSEFDLHVVVCPNVTRVSSESSCNTIAAVGEITSTGLFLGSGAPKAGSN